MPGGSTAAKAITSAGERLAGRVVGGPKWMELVPGELRSQLHLRCDRGETLRVRAPQYDEPGFDEALAQIVAEINSDPDTSLSDVEALVHELRPDDVFYENAGEHLVSGADDPLLTQ